MLRFHLTTEDLLRVRLTGGPNPLWEIAYSLRLLRTQEAVLLFDPWRREVRRALADAGLSRAVEELGLLYPPEGFWPDFLTPVGDVADLETGLDRVLATPRSELKRELTLMVQLRFALPGWASAVADGDRTTMGRVGDLLRRYYRIAVAPYAQHLQSAFAAERARRADTVLEQGARGLLPSYSSALMRWRDDALDISCSVDEEFRGEGRGVTLLPSFFSVNQPAAQPGDEHPTVVVYPLEHTLGWLPPPAAREEAPAEARGCGARHTLARLLGPARAAALEALDQAMTTSRLAVSLGLSVPTASRHAALLREAGLVESERRGQSVLHTRTPLGTALLEGRPAPTPVRPKGRTAPAWATP
ncbi:winged helix-turn-helix domain-containing protein [Streptomyces sp. NPDC006798]|uniref:ArsR/SmtB family transcription factor n=1 Tax=Streptomyces sp. NPDC006798 TaxID=3155462 RepID=UPI0033C315F2